MTKPYVSPDDHYAMSRAYMAAKKSPDPSTQNGVFIVAGCEEITAFNDFPAGVQPLQSRLERPAKYMWVEHAERNGLYKAAKRGIRLAGAKMVCPWVACADCARGIVEAGITEVVGHRLAAHHDDEGSPPAWAASIDAGLTILKEAGVAFREIEAEFDITIRFNGREITV